MPECECGAFVSKDWARVYSVNGEVKACTDCTVLGSQADEIREEIHD
jgi:hypothetical protein